MGNPRHSASSMSDKHSYTAENFPFQFEFQTQTSLFVYIGASLGKHTILCRSVSNLLLVRTCHNIFFVVREWCSGYTIHTSCLFISQRAAERFPMHTASSDACESSLPESSPFCSEWKSLAATPLFAGSRQCRRSRKSLCFSLWGQGEVNTACK